MYCVEPNDDMRSVAESELGGYKNFHSVQGNAEYMEALISLFENHSNNGIVSIANQSVAYIGVVW